MGLGPENDCAGEGQQQLQMTDPSSRQRGCYMWIITPSVKLQKENTGCGSQGAWRQDELIGGKPPVVT
jgi:hypothetical protein